MIGDELRVGLIFLFIGILIVFSPYILEIFGFLSFVFYLFIF